MNQYFFKKECQALHAFPYMLELTIKIIVLETDFFSLQHFTATLKKLSGNTSSTFRKKNIRTAN